MAIKKNMTQIFKFWFQIWNQREKLYKNHFTSRRGVFFSKFNLKSSTVQPENHSTLPWQCISYFVKIIRNQCYTRVYSLGHLTLAKNCYRPMKCLIKFCSEFKILPKRIIFLFEKIHLKNLFLAYSDLKLNLIVKPFEQNMETLEMIIFASYLQSFEF